jgi:hypothetical protein
MKGRVDTAQLRSVLSGSRLPHRSGEQNVSSAVGTARRPPDERGTLRRSPEPRADVRRNA